MPYNKNQFRKVNDKKVLHKVKSHWVAVSLSLLMALGGTAVASQTVHADNNASNLNHQNNVNNQIGNSTSTPHQLEFTNDDGTMSNYRAANEPEVTTQGINNATANMAQHYVTGPATNNEDNSFNAEINSLETPATVPSASVSASNSVPNNMVPDSSASNGSSSNGSTSSSSADPNDFIISYVSGDNGSAASYHAKASNEQSLYQINSSLAEHYLNSLNAKFGTKATSLKDNYSSLTSKYNRDQSVANKYFNVANSPGYSQEVSSLAAKNGQTTSNYVQSISYHASSFANNLSQGNALKNQMAVVNSYAQLINNLHSNSDLRIDYSLKAQSADYALGIESAYSRGFTSVANALNKASSAAGEAMLSAIVNSMNASASNAIANININRDSSTVNSLASALSFGTNTFLTSSYVNSFATASFKANSGGSMTLRGLNNSYSNVTYNANSSDAVYNLLNDINIRTTYGSKANSYENVISSAKSAQTSLSSAISSANTDVHSESSKFSSISSAAAFYDALSDPQVGLNNIFGSAVSTNNTNTASSVSVNTVDSVVDHLLNSAVDDNTAVLSSAEVSPNTIKSAINVAVPHFVSAVADNDHLVNSAGNVENVQDFAMDLGSEANKIGSALSDGFKVIKNYGNQMDLMEHGLTFNQLQQKINKYHSLYPDVTSDIYHLSQIVLAPVANDASLSNQQLISPTVAAAIFSSNGSDSNRVQNVIDNIVDSPATHQILNLLTPSQNTQYQYRGDLLNPQSYAAASDAVRAYTSAGQNLSYEVSAISSATNSAASAANSAASASDAYDSSAEVSTALAGNLLGSYDTTVYSDKQSLSAAQNSLTDFYNQYAPNYTSASSTASSASVAAPMDAKLAQAYGMHVYNYAPKYITAIKDVALKSSLDGNDSNPLATIKSGQDRISVNGVGFDRNGNTYYAVTYNGQNGYVTADPNSTKNSYLFATQNNHATVTFVRDTYEYNSVSFNKNTIVKPIKAGEQRSGVIVSEDGIYGGWTRIRLSNGNYVTANTKYIDLDNDDNNSSNNNHSNAAPQEQKVNFA